MKNVVQKITLSILLVSAGIFVLYSMFFVSTESLLEMKQVFSSEAETGIAETIVDLDSLNADYYIVADELNYEFYPGIESLAYAYNEQIPGPLIEVNLGETKRIALINNLSVDTTIHFHGIILENEMDGVPGVTQEPVKPGEYFIYEIEFNDAGLFWYHSHVDGHEQVEKGLQGPLVVRDPETEESLHEIEEEIIVIDDVLIQADGSFYDFSAGRMHGRFGNVLLTNGEYNNSFSFNSTTARLRLVNSANARSFNLYSPNLTITVLGDGIGLTESYQSEIVTINPGERYDLLIEGDIDSENMLYHVSSRDITPIATINLGSETSTVELPIYSYDEETYNQLLSKEVDYSVELKGINSMLTGLLWTLNGNHFPEQTEEFSWGSGEMMKIEMTNTQGQPHPMHFHGLKFFSLSREGIPTEDYGLKDTVMVSGFETVEIGFIPEEEGSWVYHCHILEHAEAGMLGLLNIH